MECKVCGKQVEKPKRGPTPKTCGQRCRKRLSRMGAEHPFPAQMVDATRWVRADGKRPVMPSGAPASTTNPSTWSSFSDVQGGAGDGIGYICGGGIGVIDLDDCLDGETVAPWAVKAVRDNEFPVVFVERSLSGRGLHVFVEAHERPGRVVRVSGGGTIERYFRARHVRLTGDVVDLNRVFEGKL